MLTGHRFAAGEAVDGGGGVLVPSGQPKEVYPNREYTRSIKVAAQPANGRRSYSGEHVLQRRTVSNFDSSLQSSNKCKQVL
jgi:hypothetical protein